MNGYEIKEKIVLSGESIIFKTWKGLVPALTVAEFLDGLKWVCGDSCTNGDGTGRHTREIGLTNAGIVRINHVQSSDFFHELGMSYEADTHRLWEGDFFKVPCIEKFVKNADTAKRMGYADSDGMITLRFKLSLSARDRV